MEKILSWVTDITLLLCGILFLTLSFVSLNNYTFDDKIVSAYAMNWSKGPILDIYASTDNTCRTGYENFISNSFPGIKTGCNCKQSTVQGYYGKVYPQECSESHIVYGCKMVFSLPATTLKVWRGKTLCVLRMQRNFWKLENEAGDSCPVGKKKCGVLDTTGNLLCLDKEQTCPINRIEIRSAGSPPTYQAKKISLDNMYDLYFSNIFPESKVVTEFVVSSGPICVHPFEGLLGQNDYILNTLKGKNECTTPIDNMLSDTRFSQMDQVQLQKFYLENGIDQVIQKSPGYPEPKTDQNVRLYEINYFGWRKKCHNMEDFTQEHLINPTSEVELNNKRTYAFAIICAIHFILVIGSILVYKIIIASFSTHYLLMLVFEGVNFLFVLTIFVYSIVLARATSKVLEPFYHFIYLDCGDEITNSVLKWGFKGISSVNSTIIPIAVISSLEMCYLIYFYVWTVIKKNSPGYIDVEDRERID